MTTICSWMVLNQKISPNLMYPLIKNYYSYYYVSVNKGNHLKQNFHFYAMWCALSGEPITFKNNFN